MSLSTYRRSFIMSILSVKNISKSYKKQVLCDVNFDINEGEIVGLVGPNGVGKSTLMKIISLLVSPDSGQVKVCDIDSITSRKEYLKHMSCIIEVPALYEMLTGYANINFIRKINNVSKEHMYDILKFVNIGDMINEKVKNYSLGMKQKLALGIALLTTPKLLILDEPNNGLDPQASMELKELLLRLSRENNMSILISSHILSDLNKVCSKLLFLKDAKIIDSDIANINLESQNIVLTVANPRVIIESIKTIKNIDNVTIVTDNKICINVMKDKVASVIQEITENNISYSNIEIVSDIMDSVYRSVYGGK